MYIEFYIDRFLFNLYNCFKSLVFLLFNERRDLDILLRVYRDCVGMIVYIITNFRIVFFFIL